MKKIIIWGAGKKGIGISNKLRKNDILCLGDSDEKKIGKYINGYKIEGIEEILKENPKDIILVTTIPLTESGMCNLRKNWRGKIYYYEEFFLLPEVIKQVDEDLLAQYYIDYRIRDNIFEERRENWFREDECSEINSKLIHAMQEDDVDAVNKTMDEAYNSGRKYFDEFFYIRPGMRLIYNILNNELHNKARIIDFACGHGELIQKLAKAGHFTYAVDFSADRLKELVNVEVAIGDVKSTIYENDYFDVSICMECLEHIDNVVDLSDEIIRVTKPMGLIFVTVPYLRHCDDEMHVRQFDEVKLWSLFSNRCELENILVIPYLNYTSDDNLLIVMRKRK